MNAAQSLRWMGKNDKLFTRNILTKNHRRICFVHDLLSRLFNDTPMHIFIIPPPPPPLRKVKTQPLPLPQWKYIRPLAGWAWFH